jgi:hypothetical protein
MALIDIHEIKLAQPHDCPLLHVLTKVKMSPEQRAEAFSALFLIYPFTLCSFAIQKPAASICWSVSWSIDC